MSYCRFIECDVYLYEHVNGFACCCSCRLSEEEDNVSFKTPAKALEHLYEHKKAGHWVIESAIAELEYEVKTNYGYIPIKSSVEEN